MDEDFTWHSSRVREVVNGNVLVPYFMVYKFPFFDPLEDRFFLKTSSRQNL